VLGEALLKHYTAPGQAHSVDEYAAKIAREPKPADRAPLPDTSKRTPATSAMMARWLGVWRDPWFGEVAICAREGRVRFEAAKSPRLAGAVMQVGGRALVDWDSDAADVEAWLDFGKDDRAGTLKMAKVDPDGDFSSDYEDLAFVRARDCE
jgi:hypothetical protein